MSPTTKRLLREAKELSPASPNPSPYFHAAPLSDSDLFEWHFTILGPPAPSPYANGTYHGRIVLPPQYPLRPPSFRFLTPSGRFEVNREICLSISGHHEETWQPAWGIRTALTAIRAFMSGDAKGQVGGLDANEERRKDLAGKSRTWRCVACGAKTNEEILKRWAEDVRESGGTFAEEDEGDQLPDGLRVGYKDELTGQKTAKADESSTSNAPEQSTTSQANAVSSISSPATTSSGPSQPPPVEVQQHSRQGLTRQLPLPPQQPSALLPQSQSQPMSQPPPTRTVQAALALPRTATPTPVQLRPRPIQVQVRASAEEVSPPWLDRAIAGIFLALVIMMVKKFYYPYT